MKDKERFWQALDALVASSKLVVDRPKGSLHPRHPALRYPLDYGYLAGTQAGDGDGIDVWLGKRPERRVTAIVCTVDGEQRDAEVKILLGCSREESHRILAVHNRGGQSAILIERPDLRNPPKSDEGDEK